MYSKHSKHSKHNKQDQHSKHNSMHCVINYRCAPVKRLPSRDSSRKQEACVCIRDLFYFFTCANEIGVVMHTIYLSQLQQNAWKATPKTQRDVNPSTHIFKNNDSRVGDWIGPLSRWDTEKTTQDRTNDNNFQRYTARFQFRNDTNVWLGIIWCHWLFNNDLHI